MLYDVNGNSLSAVWKADGTSINSAYSIDGDAYAIGDYSDYSNEFQHTILNARNAWLEEARSGDDVIQQIIHADQHGRLTANNTLFPYLGLSIKWSEVSACIGLGDVSNYSIGSFSAMKTCLDDIPANKQINIWGNHDTWGGSRLLSSGQYVPTDDEYRDVLSYYFDNSAYNGNVRYNNYGIESMIDAANGIKYVVIGGWEYADELGGYSHYVIGSQSMQSIIEMLSNTDGNDIVILSHIQPFDKNKSHALWTVPYEDACGGGGLKEETSSAVPSTLVNGAETTIDDMLIARKNKTSGTVKDSFGNSHSYDFTNCAGDLICCYSGHEHCNWWMIQNNNIPVVVYDAYAYDTHPFYFVNINRTKKHLSVWRVDDTPQFIKWTIPMESQN